MTDQDYMKIALQLAKKGCGFVNPNPMVGAVIVKEGRIIGRGYHQYYGGLHAERNAIADCKEPLQGSVLYVTLEPCCHQGKTPPCTEAIIKSGIRRVVVGVKDTNPAVAGKGLSQLKEAGIEVEEGVMQKECSRLNEVFSHYVAAGTPYVVMKYAMTMDGKIAAYTGKSKWITGETARMWVQEDRHRYMAIMVGAGTVLQDDPMLTSRITQPRNPIRVICDTHLRTPETANVIKTAGEIPTILATCCQDERRHKEYLSAGCEVLILQEKNGRPDLNDLMKALGERGIDSILLEGGSTLNWSALECGIVHKLQTYIAPKLFGGQQAKSPIAGVGVVTPDQAYRLRDTQIIRLGEDILIESEVVSCLPE